MADLFTRRDFLHRVALVAPLACDGLRPARRRASSKDVIDIRDFGADPTRKDNASQINEAFAQAGNGTTVLIPPLTFGFESAGLIITKGIVVTGEGNASRLVYNGAGTA